MCACVCLSMLVCVRVCVCTCVVIVTSFLYCNRAELIIRVSPFVEIDPNVSDEYTHVTCQSDLLHQPQVKDEGHLVIYHPDR